MNEVNTEHNEVKCNYDKVEILACTLACPKLGLLPWESPLRNARTQRPLENPPRSCCTRWIIELKSYSGSVNHWDYITILQLSEGANR